MRLKSLFTGGFLTERVVLLALVGGLGYACLTIVAPFVPPFIWAMILALSTWPYYQRLTSWLGGRRKLAALLLTGVQLLIFVVPTIMALTALTNHVPNPEATYEAVDTWLKGEPPDWLTNLPWVGERLDADWREGKLFSLLEPGRLRAALTTAGKWLLQESANLALNILTVVLAVAMAGLLYSNGEKGAVVAEKLALRIGGEAAVQALRTAANTVRGVSLGVIGTALIQALLSGIGFALAGLTAAPALGLVCFLAALLQIGTGIVWIPVAAWLAHIDQNAWAVFTVVWGIAINLMDNFIKPYFIGLASPLPFLLIMVGVVGGLLAWGFVGIFLGTTLLAVAYTTFFGWLERPSDD